MSRQEKLQADEAQQTGDALDTLQAVGATGLVRFRGFNFPVQESAQVGGEAVAFHSPYVSMLGEKEGLENGTPVVTKGDFERFVKNTYSGQLMTEQGISYLVDDVYGTVSRQAQLALPPRGLVWHIHYKSSEDLQQTSAINPFAVIALFADYETARDIPHSLVAGRVRASVWHKLAQHLEESLLPTER